MVSACNNIQNTQIRLMRHHPVNFLCGDARPLERGVDRKRYGSCGKAHDRCTLHFQETRLRVHRAVTGKRILDRQGFHVQVLCTRAVCRGEGGQNADCFVLGRLINGRSGTVAEQNAGRAVGVVHDARKRFRRYNQRGLCLAGFNVTVRNVGRGDKAGAGVIDVERADLTRTQLVLQDRRRIRRVGIRRAGADENEVKLLCGDACVRECVLCGTERQLPCMCILCDAALAHTGALHDPLIAGIYHFFQHGVGQDKIRNAGARADQFTVDDFHAPKKSKSLSQKAWKSDNS